MSSAVASADGASTTRTHVPPRPVARLPVAPSVTPERPSRRPRLGRPLRRPGSVRSNSGLGANAAAAILALEQTPSTSPPSPSDFSSPSPSRRDRPLLTASACAKPLLLQKRLLRGRHAPSVLLR